LKGAPGGKTYVGPEGPPASPQDREVTFDGRVLVLRWMDVGTMRSPQAQAR